MDYLSRVDLNLLTPLAALLDERHVSRAADRVGITQPAMSHALRRLRAVLGDELLVRSGGGYVLTPRAERLQRQLNALVPQIGSLFAGDAFDPMLASERFHLAGTDYPALVFGAELSQRLVRASPRSVMRFSAWHDGVFDDLVRGALDLAFYGSVPPPPLRTEALFDERFVCVVDAGHPLADRGAALSLAEYLACSHVSVEIYDGQGIIDRYLKSAGTERNVSVRLPYHLVAATVVRGTSLVATLPSRMFSGAAIDPQLRVLGAPPEIESMPYVMVWHPRLDDDPAQRWLRDVIRSTAREL